MKKRILLTLIAAIFFVQLDAQESSFIVLGDTHYDLIEDHDMDWLKSEMPSDIRQIDEYTSITKENWNDFMSTIKEKVLTSEYHPKAILQLGDLSEGLAGTPEKAQQMAANTIQALENTKMPVPWILTKGNHDITGPGAKQAFQDHYIPFIRKETANSEIQNANYSYRFDNVQITCIDSYNSNVDLSEFLDKELSSSDAKYKFVAVHEPVIPVTERCWHMLRRTPVQREKLLEVIAKNNAIVLCGHLHRYSVVARNTDFGPIVQVMSISVVRDRDYLKPEEVITEYGPSLAENKPDWQPETIEKRMDMLKDEAAYVTYYKQTDLPGYAQIIIDENKEEIRLEYYSAFGEKPYDKVNLTELLK